MAITMTLMAATLGVAAPTQAAQVTSPDIASSTCINFEDLAVGTNVPVDTEFVTDGRTIQVKPLDYFTGGPFVGGHADVENAGRAGGGGKDLYLNDADLNISYTVPISGLSILHGDYGTGVGSRVNLVINNLATDLGSPCHLRPVRAKTMCGAP